ncbi:MAG: cyclodeaminase/cyclohydrolase family protein [Anaerolineae bacterium]|nr:cyclodeaminase/cyclohydrolase family protein [Anaerolineae bacterium]
MLSLAEQTLTHSLGALAAATPTPGGGSAAALTGATAAALVEMVCGLTIGREKFAAAQEEVKQVLARAQTLRPRLLALAEEDAAAFDALTAAYKLPKGTEAEKSARGEAIQQALRAATETPVRTAEAAAEVVTLARAMVEKGNPNAASDAGVAVLLAEAAVQGAALNVRTNLGGLKDAGFAHRAREYVSALAVGAEATRAVALATLAARWA